MDDVAVVQDSVSSSFPNLDFQLILCVTMGLVRRWIWVLVSLYWYL